VQVFPHFGDGDQKKKKSSNLESLTTQRNELRGRGMKSGLEERREVWNI
jgi:hypothetical protein